MVGIAIKYIAWFEKPIAFRLSSIAVPNKPAMPVPHDTSPTSRDGKPFKKPRKAASPSPCENPVKTLAPTATQKKFLFLSYMVAKAMSKNERMAKVVTM